MWGSVGGGDAAPNELRTQHKLLRGALADWVPKETPDTPVLRRAGMEGPVDGTAEGEFQGAGSAANGHQPRLTYLLVFPLCCAFYSFNPNCLPRRFRGGLLVPSASTFPLRESSDHELCGPTSHPAFLIILFYFLQST